jgi:hypothetical protein
MPTVYVLRQAIRRYLVTMSLDVKPRPRSYWLKVWFGDWLVTWWQMVPVGFLQG